MQSIQEIQALIDEAEVKLNALREQKKQAIERARAAEIPELIARIKELGLTAADLGINTAKKTKTKSSSNDGPKKYRNPETGDEWSGRGNVPGWAKGKDYDQFLNPAWSDLPSNFGSSSESNHLTEAIHLVTSNSAF